MTGRPGYDPDLPILAELEAGIERAAVRRLTAPGTATKPAAAANRGPEQAPRDGRRVARPHRRARWRGTGHVPMRAALLAGLVCLVGASAYAVVARDGTPRQTERIVIDAASRPDERRMELYARGGRACVAFVLPETVDGACAPAPRPAEGSARSVSSAFTRYVYGLTGADVRRVNVRAGVESRAAATRQVPAEAARAGGLPETLRYYVVAFERGPGADDPPALVRLESASSRRLGTLVDCTLGQLDRRCDAG
jgi:hypothetical protein